MNNTALKKPTTKRLTQGVFLLLLMIFTWWFQQQPNLKSELDQAILQQRSDVVNTNGMIVVELCIEPIMTHKIGGLVVG